MIPTLQRLNDISPMFCRLMAKHPRGAAMTTVELAEASGLSPHIVEAYSWSESWDDIPMLAAFRYSEACGMHILDWRARNRIYAYINKNTKHTAFRHIRKSPLWSSYYRPMLIKWHASFHGRHQHKLSDVWLPVRRLLLKLDKVVALYQNSAP